MPEYLISDGAELPRFARVDNGKKVVWVNIEVATGFATKELAIAGVKAACETMRLNLAGGSLPKEGQPWKIDNNNKPNWLFKRRRYDKFPVASRATTEDLMGAFDVFFVRSKEGWLCRPERISQGAALGWNPTFSLAAPFSSHEAALSALQASRQSQGFIVKSSAVLTQVSAVGTPEADPLMEQLHCACERRDLAKEIHEQSQLRLKALAQFASERQHPVPAGSESGGEAPQATTPNGPLSARSRRL